MKTISFYMAFLYFTVSFGQNKTQCGEQYESKKSFFISLRITNSQSYPQEYIVTQDSFFFRYRNDAEKIYKTKLDKQQSADIYKIVKQQNLDTLKAEYRRKAPNCEDCNQEIIFKVSGDWLPSKTIYSNNYLHPALEAILLKVDKLVRKKRYRWYQN